MARSIFYAFGAFVGSIDGEYKCGFWAVDPAGTWDASKLIKPDLSKNPAAALVGTIPWSRVEIDDHTSAGGMTKIGPRFHNPPGFGATAGPAYLEESWYNALAAGIKPTFPPTGFQARDYEFKAAIYQNGTQQGTRYLGFHAKIIGESGASANVQVWDGGVSLVPGQAPKYTGWIDLSLINTVDKHTSAGGLTAIAVGAGQTKEGALYIENVHRQSFSLLHPKLPPGLHNG